MPDDTDTHPEISQEAARAMLAALRQIKSDMIEWGDPGDEALEMMDAAIALAEGRA